MSNRDMQQEAPQKYQEKVFEEFKELEEQREKEALEFVQKTQSHPVAEKRLFFFFDKKCIVNNTFDQLKMNYRRSIRS